jgi:hypothetical protein
MDTNDIITYYSDLLILQYKGLPKATATIQALVAPFVMDQLPILVQNAYNVDTAVGVQLDVIGKYAGISRSGYTFAGPVTLNDDDYRVIIQLKQAKNSGTTSLDFIQTLIANFFPDTLLVFDYRGMRIQYFLDSTQASTTLAQFVVKQGLLPKPMGVSLGLLIYAPNIKTFFCFRTYENPIYNGSDANTYDSYQTDRPFLDYDLALAGSGG